MTNYKHLGSDEAVKDLLLAMLTSNNTDGSVVVNANWDQVLDTMNSWGYNFTKSAMSEFLALIYNHTPTCNTLHISRPVVVVLRWGKKRIYILPLSLPTRKKPLAHRYAHPFHILGDAAVS